LKDHCQYLALEQWLVSAGKVLFLERYCQVEQLL